MAGSRRTVPGPGSHPVVRCFIGLPLPESWQAGLGRVALALSGQLSSRISWTRPGNGHLTLKFLGEVEQARLPELTQALAGVVFAPFALAVGRAGFFPPAGSGSPRALWAGLAQGGTKSARLAAQVGQALAPLGFAPETRPFSAHLTLGRVKDAAAGDDWSLVERTLAGETWPVAEASSFVLWRSVLGAGGAAVFPAGGIPGPPGRGGGSLASCGGVQAGALSVAFGSAQTIAWRGHTAAAKYLGCQIRCLPSARVLAFETFAQE